MKLAVMQPYFLPYIGYFQLIASSDLFIVYDNIKFTKKGWINRNRILQNGKERTFSVAIKGDSDFLDIRERELAESFDRPKLLNQIQSAYRRAPNFESTFVLLKDIVCCDETNLFQYLLYSIRKIAAHLEISTEIVISSTIDIEHGLKAQEKILALCESVGATTYINPIGGLELYSKESFWNRGIALKFLKSQLVEYEQFQNPFVPALSIIDVMMFNDLDVVKTAIRVDYELM